MCRTSAGSHIDYTSVLEPESVNAHTISLKIYFLLSFGNMPFEVLNGLYGFSTQELSEYSSILWWTEFCFLVISMHWDAMTFLIFNRAQREDTQTENVWREVRMSILWLGNHRDGAQGAAFEMGGVGALCWFLWTLLVKVSKSRSGDMSVLILNWGLSSGHRDNSDYLKVLLGLSSADQSEFSLPQQTYFRHTLLLKHVLRNCFSRKQRLFP